MNTKKKIIKFYDQTLSKYRPNDPAIVAWNSKESQELRFFINSSIADLTQSSILDLGCGVGDFYGYLTQNVNFNEYHGIDIHPKMIKLAKKKHGDYYFSVSDIFDWNGSYDFVFASGPFNLKLENNEDYIQRAIHKMGSLCKKGFAFNLLSNYDPKNILYEKLYYYNPLKIFDYCKKEFERVILRHDYMKHDFTIYVYI